jgi:multiple RNA-binding domain-containing protein 1
MASSRIYVSGLPPSISEADFRRHFSRFPVTDVRLIAKRRIGFVGFHSSDEAARAVKYYNRSYIRMSKIRVELATPPQQVEQPAADAKAKTTRQPGASDAKARPSKEKHAEQDELSRKRKRDDPEEEDEKLQEYLELMQPGRAIKKAREADDPSRAAEMETATVAQEAGDDSDDDYENLPNSMPKERPKGPRSVEEISPTVAQPEVDHHESGTAVDAEEPEANGHSAADMKPNMANDVADDEWLRQRKSRLLDLVDPDDPVQPERAAQPTRLEDQEHADQSPDKFSGEVSAGHDKQGTPEEQDHHEDDPKELVQKTARLFLRNLAFDVSQDDILDIVEPFGSVKEVSCLLCCCDDSNYSSCDESHLIGTAYAFWRLMIIRASILVDALYLTDFDHFMPRIPESPTGGLTSILRSLSARALHSSNSGIRQQRSRRTSNWMAPPSKVGCCTSFQQRKSESWTTSRWLSFHSRNGK